MSKTTYLLKARSDGLRKTQWDREFSNWLRFMRAKNRPNLLCFTQQITHV